MDRPIAFRRPRARALLAGVGAVTVLAVAALAAPAHAATFAPQQQVGTLGSDPAYSVHGQLFEDGSAAVEWGFIWPQLTLRTPGQPFGPRRQVGRELLRLGAGPRGGGLAAFDEAGRRSAAAVVSGGTLGRTVDLGPGRPGDPLVNARGDAIVPVHVGIQRRLRLMLRPRGAARFRTAFATDDFYDYALVPLRDGFALAWWSWEECAGPGLYVGCVQVHGAVARDGRGFGPAQALGPARGVRQRSSAIDLRLAPRAGTGALVAWNGHGRTARVRTATLAPRGTRFGRASVISRPDRRAHQVEAVANARGEALVTWIERGPRRAGELRLATLGRDGRFHGARRMSAADIDARSPRLRLNDRGDVVLSWSSGPRWWVRTRTPTRPFTPAHELPTSPRPWQAQLALDRAGTVLVLFLRPTGDETGSIEGGDWPAGTVPRTRTLDPVAGWRGPTLVTNAGGTAFAAWRDDEGLTATVRQPGGSFDAPVIVGTEIVQDPRPHINRRGDLLLVTYGDLGEPGELADYEIGAVLGTATR